MSCTKLAEEPCSEYRNQEGEINSGFTATLFVAAVPGAQSTPQKSVAALHQAHEISEFRFHFCVITHHLTFFPEALPGVPLLQKAAIGPQQEASGRSEGLGGFDADLAHDTPRHTQADETIPPLSETQ
jgi:hypothetical protein